MTAAQTSATIARLFSDPKSMDDVIRRAHAAVIKRHAAWQAPLVISRNGTVERVAATTLLTNGSDSAMPSMWPI